MCDEKTWRRIRAAYERGEGSTRELAQRFKVPYPTLRDRSRREGWRVSAQQVRSQAVAKTSQILIERAALDAAGVLSLQQDLYQQVAEKTAAMLAAVDKARDLKALADSVKVAVEGLRQAVGLKDEQPTNDQGETGEQDDDLSNLDTAELARRVAEQVRGG